MNCYNFFVLHKLRLMVTWVYVEIITARDLKIKP